MTRPRLLLVLAAAIVAVVGWLCWWPPQDPAPQRQRGQPAATATSEPTPARTPERTQVAAPSPSARTVGPATAGPGGRAPTTAPGLHGVVRESQGAGVPDILLELVDAAGATLLETTSGPKGRFAFADVAPAAKALTARPSRAGLPRVRHATLPVTSNQRVVVWIPPTGTITGSVVDAHGEPVAGAHVATDRPFLPFGMMTWQVIEGDEVKASFGAETDAQGRFRLPFCLRGAHRLRASHDGATGSARVDGNERGVVLRLGSHLDGDVTFSGRLSDRLTGAPIAGARVWVERVTRTTGGYSSTGVANATTAADGRYQVQGIDAGRYRLGASPAGYARFEVDERDYEPGQHEIGMALMPARSVSVRVVLPDGTPAKGARLRARDRQGRAVKMPGRLGMMGDEVPVDGEGRAVLRRLPAQPLTLIAVRGDFVPAASLAVDLTAATPEPLTMQLPTSTTRFARRHFFLLLGADGQPADIDGIVVACAFDGERLLSRVEGRWRDEKFVLGNDERYDFSRPTIAVGASANACRVEITAAGYRPVTLTLQPDATSPTRVELRR